MQIIGFNPDTGIGEPWAMAEGVPHDVKGGHYMIIDSTSEQRLGRLATGTLWELTVMNRERSFKLIGLSQGIKSFTTTPIVFTSFNRLSAMFAEAGWGDQTSFVVAKLRHPEAAGRIADALRMRLKDNDVFTKQEFIERTVRYWTVQTGMGMAFFLTAALAMIIGGTIVGQTIYSSTIEHLREFGTLKAIGAKNHEIYQVVLAQATISAVAGYAVASIVTLLMRARSRRTQETARSRPPRRDREALRGSSAARAGGSGLRPARARKDAHPRADFGHRHQALPRRR